MRLLVCLLILCPILAWSQPSTPASSESTTCFTNSELAAFEAAVQAEMERTIKEAVEAAVLPYVEAVEKKDGQLKTLRICLGVSVGVAVGALLWAVVK
ncbi:MAG: hypothetical protein NTV38_09775 [Chloroflexi bacterium]|nr:hypothetical protein [Chloroflexota bacterium]